MFETKSLKTRFFSSSIFFSVMNCLPWRRTEIQMLLFSLSLWPPSQNEFVYCFRFVVEVKQKKGDRSRLDQRFDSFFVIVEYRFSWRMFSCRDFIVLFFRRKQKKKNWLLEICIFLFICQMRGASWRKLIRTIRLLFLFLFENRSEEKMNASAFVSVVDSLTDMLKETGYGICFAVVVV